MSHRSSHVSRRRIARCWASAYLADARACAATMDSRSRATGSWSAATDSIQARHVLINSTRTSTSARLKTLKSTPRAIRALCAIMACKYMYIQWVDPRAFRARLRVLTVSGVGYWISKYFFSMCLTAFFAADAICKDERPPDSRAPSLSLSLSESLPSEVRLRLACPGPRPRPPRYRDCS